MEIEIAPLSMVPAPESLALEHTNFTVEFAPTRSDNALQSSARRSLTLRYNTPPRMPLEVVEDGGILKFLDGTKQWQVVTNSPQTVLNDLIFWAWPSGITNPNHPDYVVKFEVCEDGVLFDEYTPEECLMSGQSNLQSLVPQDLKHAGYNIHCSLATTGSEITIYAVDAEGVRSLATTSGRAPHAITLNANGGNFGSSDMVTVFRAAGSSLTGGDLDIPTRSGYYLSGWTADGAPVTFPYTVSAPVTLTAQWTMNPSSDGGGGAVVPSTYTVTFDAAGGKFADGKDSLAETVQGNNKVTEPTLPARAGWVFTWWKDPATGSAYDFSRPVTGDLTLTANWTQEFYVNPSNGDDTSLGTRDKPLRNLQAAVDKIGGLNDGTSTYTILLMGDVVDSSPGSYDSGKNSALVNIVPAKTLSLTIKSDADGATRTINAGRNATNTGRVFYVGGANTTVTLRDLVVTGGYSTESGGGIHIAGGTVTLGGSATISANEALNGGGVSISDGKLEMEGGEIARNKATTNGGGIYLLGGTFTMKEGEVSGNNATNGNGGGVFVAANSTFTAGGGTIGGDSGKKNVATNGGGVYIAGAGTDASTTPGKLVLAGATISHNESSTSGGGVANYGTLEMSSGSISNNVAGHNGGGVNNAGALTMTEGIIESNTATNDGGGVYVAAKNTFTMENGSISSNTGVNGGGVYVQGGKYSAYD